MKCQDEIPGEDPEGLQYAFTERTAEKVYNILHFFMQDSKVLKVTYTIIVSKVLDRILARW